jgi:AraC-like DNA-binding protein
VAAWQLNESLRRFIKLAMRHQYNVQRIDFSTLWAGGSAGHATTKAILMTSGCAEVELNRRLSVCAGDLYVIPAGAPHYFYGALSTEATGWGFDLGAHFDLRDLRKAVTRLEQPRAADLSGWLSRIVIEQRNNDACSRALCETLARALQIECARAVGIARCDNQSRLVAGAMQIIGAEYSRPLRPKDIAERLGVSAAHLSHELQRRTGRSPSEWIMHTRVEAAKTLLLTSQSSTAAVAEAVGYGDVSQLNRTFRQLTGASPAAWRRANGAHNSTN